MKDVQRPRLHRWKRDAYERLIDHGILDEDDPIELLDGLLLVKEPQNSPHRTATILVAKALEQAFGHGWFVQVQSPIALDVGRCPSRTSASFRVRRATTRPHIRPGRRSSSRSRN